MTLGGAVWSWGATVFVAAQGLALLYVVHGRWGVGLAILAGGVALLFGVRCLSRALRREREP